MIINPVILVSSAPIPGFPLLDAKLPKHILRRPLSYPEQCKEDEKDLPGLLQPPHSTVQPKSFINRSK